MEVVLPASPHHDEPTSSPVVDARGTSRRMVLDSVWPAQTVPPPQPGVFTRLLMIVRAVVTLVLVGAFVGGPPAVVVWTRRWWAPTIPTQEELLGSLREEGPQGSLAFVTVCVAVILTLTTVCWLVVAYALLAELAASLRLVHLPRPRLPSPVRSAIAGLAGAAAIALSTSSATAGPTAAGTAAVATLPPDQTPVPDITHATWSPHAGITVVTSSTTAPGAAGSDTANRTMPASLSAGGRPPQWTPHSAEQGPSREPLEYVVHRGDRMWDIAERFLGDPHRYPDIAALNPGYESQHPTYPNHIEQPWRLRLPADAHDRGPRRHATGRLHRPPAPTPPATTPPPTWPPPTPPAVPIPPTTPKAGPPAAPAPIPPGSPAPPTPRPSHPPTGAPTSEGTSPPDGSPSGSSTGPASDATTGNPPANDDRTTSHADGRDDRDTGISLPSQGWVSLGLAATIAAAAGLLRLHRRRHARLSFPIPVRTGPTPSPVPASLRLADTRGASLLLTRAESPLPHLVPHPSAVPAPIGVDEHGTDISLFHTPGTALGLDGDGAPGAARAVIAAALTTGVTDHLAARPILVTPATTLAGLLPADVPPVGLDPHQNTFDGERLHVVADTAAAISHAEVEMIHRRRLLDSMTLTTVTDLNSRHDHAEHQPPFVLLVPADDRYTARLRAVAAHRAALHLHTVILGATDDTWTGVHRLHVGHDGTITVAPSTSGHTTTGGGSAQGRLATLTARALADVLIMVAATAPRPETGTEPTDTSTEPATSEATLDISHLPPPGDQASIPVRLTVLGPPTLATTTAPITTGVRRGSLAVLALLAAHPEGRTIHQIADALHPDTNVDTAVNRVRTDINAVRRLLRQATGVDGRGAFILYDSTTSRYRIDPTMISVDLWRMLTAIDHANNADDDTACLAALREAADLYHGDFADGHDRAWTIDYATTYRHQLLNIYARIAEILETDHPDQAITALDQAIHHDPINEELYQRLMRIHGRLGRPDAVRRTLRLLETRLAELGDTEPTQTTRRVAERQTTPTRHP